MKKLVSCLFLSLSSAVFAADPVIYACLGGSDACAIQGTFHGEDQDHMIWLVKEQHYKEFTAARPDLFYGQLTSEEWDETSDAVREHNSTNQMNLDKLPGSSILCGGMILNCDPPARPITPSAGGGGGGGVDIDVSSGNDGNSSGNNTFGNGNNNSITIGNIRIIIGGSSSQQDKVDDEGPSDPPKKEVE